MLENDLNVFSAYSSCGSAGISLLVECSLDADVDVVFAGDGGWLVVANVAVKGFKLRLVTVYAPNIAVERVSFFSRLALFQDDSKRLVLMDDWNAILDAKIDKVERGARRLGRCVGLMTRHDLVERFRLDHPRREVWTWLDSSPSAKVGFYLDRVFVRRADIDFVSCPTCHLIAWTDHNPFRVSLWLANRPSLVGYWKSQCFLTGDTGLPGLARIPNQAGVSGGGYREYVVGFS